VATLAKTLLGFAFLLAVVGGMLLLLSRFGMNRLPGDVVVRRRNVVFYMPVGLMILVSLVLTIVLNLFSRR
jgi:hypothetical protein